MKDLPKIYNPQEIEDKIYKKWEKSGYFNPDNLELPEDAKTYTIVLPPPNITDKLHLGHVSMLAIEDLLIRYHRMKGFRTLWIPGTDHAAIATQNVVEKKLLREKGLTRHDLGREKFLEEVQKFLEKTQKTILRQIKKTGASLDWSREAFTLDQQREKAVRKMFVDMYEAGIIYRGERIVNWCPRCHSTLADDEIEYKKQKAEFYTFKYSGDFPFAISTTRPETKLGDTAVAVNPKDKRYKKYIGRTFEVDFCGVKLKLKIIADKNVDMDLGTGALGITPAHSMVDWQMAEKNNLDIVKVIGEDGKIRAGFKNYSGKTAAKARGMVIKELKKQDLLEKEEEIENNLSLCYRCNTPIEPLPSKQWFVSVDKKMKRLGNKSLKEKAIEAIEKERIKFVPERFKKRYLDWMENLRDWCVSRQIWFGHRIPAYYKLKTKSGKLKAVEKIYVGLEKPAGEGWIQDPDTLDTWFSSGMWTFSTLGWPQNFKDNKKSGDLKKFHPTQVLETGYEILTLWVSRMVMMSLFALNEIPFEKVYLHGMVLDEHGKKMSKSKGNGIDPLDMIKKFGADSVRLAMLIGNTPGNDMKISEEKIESFRNFTNKLWNINRYIDQHYFKHAFPDKKDISRKITENTKADKWIINKFIELIKSTEKDIKEHRFSQAGERLKDFTWNDFADWYLEISKFETTTNKGMFLRMILNDLMRMWHPFIPFVTESIWEGRQGNKQELLMIEKWPTINTYENIIDGKENFDLIKEIIIAIRNIRTKNKIPAGKKIKVIVQTDKETATSIKENEILIKNLRTHVEKLEIAESGKKPKNSAHQFVAGINIYVPLTGLIDIEKEKAKNKKELENLKKYANGLERKLKNKSFLEKAPKEIVLQEKENLKKAKVKIREIEKYLESLKK
ncbi:valine--tRNA ligase [bacterium]|nr:valine--tRNA ligase [bacterium]